MFDYNHPTYREARCRAISRSDGWCQFCGLRKATEGHHWRGYKGGHYKPEEETMPEELTALCSSCHKLATIIRNNYKDHTPDNLKTLDWGVLELSNSQVCNIAIIVYSCLGKITTNPVEKIKDELIEERLEEEGDPFEDERIKLEKEREEIEEVKEYLVHVAEEKGIDIRHAILHLD